MKIITQKKKKIKERKKEGNMKSLVIGLVLIAASLMVDVPNSPTFPGNPFKTEMANAAIKWVSSSNCSRGGYFRDTSNDGYSYNNANSLGLNDW